MPDEIVLAIATTLATKGAEAMIAGGKSAIAALVGLVRGRFGTDSQEAVALREAVADPAERERQFALADVLAQAMADDHRFAEQVLAHWHAVRAEVTVDRGVVVNQFSGIADKVMQVRDVHGTISL